MYRSSSLIWSLVHGSEGFSNMLICFWMENTKATRALNGKHTTEHPSPPTVTENTPLVLDVEPVPNPTPVIEPVSAEAHLPGAAT
ncbi:hypothetical protein AKJ16_DCAP01804 [Drosera capensis]